VVCRFYGCVSVRRTRSSVRARSCRKKKKKGSAVPVENVCGATGPEGASSASRSYLRELRPNSRSDHPPSAGTASAFPTSPGVTVVPRSAEAPHASLPSISPIRAASSCCWHEWRGNSSWQPPFARARNKRLAFGHGCRRLPTPRAAA